MRRAPRNKGDHAAFLFDNLIDYKSFEFLAKLFKISERLIEYDDDMTIMNMWFKLVDHQRANYEILAKFLIHMLSGTMVKLKSQAAKKAMDGSQISMKQQQVDLDSVAYGHQYEKQRRYAINILNFIKVRMQRTDVRNSIQLAPESLSWSKKLIEILPVAQLSAQSKVVLEKVKLKKILQAMHREINYS